VRPVSAAAGLQPRRRLITASAAAVGLLLLPGAATHVRARTIGRERGGGVDAGAFGVAADGRTDDTRALQTALDAAAADGPICRVPRGLVRLDGPLTVPAGVSLKGASGAVPHSEHPVGTILLSRSGRGDADGVPQITLKPNASVCNLTIHYPEQRFPHIVPYPWTIRIDGELCQVRDIALTNPYQAIDAGTRWNELHLIRNVFACPLKTGIYVDQCTDIGRIENVHFNPNLWTRMKLGPPFPGGDIKPYLLENLTGFKLGRTDWQFISGSFVIFAKVGFHFDDFGHGPGNAMLVQSGSDLGPLAVRVEQSQRHAGVAIANGQFMSTVEIGPRNRGPVKIANSGFWGTPATREQVRHNGAGSLMLTGCHFTGWDAAGRGDPCIRAGGGRLTVSGCEFMDEGKRAVALEKGLIAATIFGCTFRGRAPIENHSDADVQIGLNSVR
jgi:hypothetical protein